MHVQPAVREHVAPQDKMPGRGERAADTCIAFRGLCRTGCVRRGPWAVSQFFVGCRVARVIVQGFRDINLCKHSVRHGWFSGYFLSACSPPGDPPLTDLSRFGVALHNIDFPSSRLFRQQALPAAPSAESDVSWPDAVVDLRIRKLNVSSSLAEETKMQRVCP